MQAQYGQGLVEPVQARDKPARQQAARAAEDERAVLDLALEVDADATQAGKGLGRRVTQTHTRICEFKATPFQGEQGNPQVLLQPAYLPTDSAVGHVQFVCRQADAAQAGGDFKGAQGIKRRKVVAHL